MLTLGSYFCHAKTLPLPNSYPKQGVPIRSKQKEIKAGVGPPGKDRLDPAECYLSSNMMRESLAATRANPGLRKKFPTLIASEEGFCDMLHSKSAKAKKVFKDSEAFSEWCENEAGPICRRECFALANLFDLSQVPRALEPDDCQGCLIDDDCSAEALKDSLFHPGQGVLTLQPVSVKEKIFMSDQVDTSMPEGGALPNINELQRRSPWSVENLIRNDHAEYPKL